MRPFLLFLVFPRFSFLFLLQFLVLSLDGSVVVFRIVASVAVFLSNKAFRLLVEDVCQTQSKHLISLILLIVISRIVNIQNRVVLAVGDCPDRR